MKAASFALLLVVYSLPLASAQPGNAVCTGAIALQLDEDVQGSLLSGTEEAWFSMTGAGERLAVSTCTGDETTDGSAFDSILEVYSGNCDNLELVISDDDSGACGNLKSQAGWQPNAGEIYYIRVTGFGGDLGSFGLTVFPSEETLSPVTIPPATVPPESLCENAVAVALDEIVQGEDISGFGTWYSFVGTGEDLLVSTCTGTDDLDNTPFDSVVEVYARGCDDLRYIRSDDESGKCGNGKSAVILPSVIGLTYSIRVYEYASGTGSFGIKVSAIN